MTVTQQTRPRGRRPGHDDTRGAIARCALELFENRGYDATSLRAIAREAEVDPALVHHYFGCKAQLFAAVCLQLGPDLVDRLNAACEGDLADAGARLAKALLETWAAPRHRARLAGYLGEDDGHRRLVHEFLAREFCCRIATAAGHANSLARGQFAASAALGVLDGRDRLGLSALAAMAQRSAAVPLGRLLQHLLVEPW